MFKKIAPFLCVCVGFFLFFFFLIQPLIAVGLDKGKF